MIVDVQSVKGGTGKSVVCRFVVDHFIAQNPLVIDTDTGNPDVARSYMTENGQGKKCDVLAIDTSKESGFGKLLDAIAEAAQSGRHVIINRGARNQAEMSAFGPALAAMSTDLGLDLVTLWVMDADKICVEQLYSFLKTMGNATRTIIIKNLGMTTDGDESRFAFVEETKTGKALPSVFFPTLPDSVMDALKSPVCKAVHELDDHLTMGARYLARGKINAAKKAIEDALLDAKIKDQQ